MKKKQVYFIATRYRNNPIKISYYTKDGEEILEEKVEKEKTKEGIKLYTFASS